MTQFPVDEVLLAVGVLLVVAVLVISLSDRSRVPAAILSLGVGMAFGSDALGLIFLDDMSLVRDLSVFALVIILFEGGLTTKPSALRETGLPGLSLATLGVVLTALVTAGAALLVFEVDFSTAMLVGFVVASTDAAVVFDLIRRAPLPRRLAGILEVESGANDPVAIVLTLGLLASIEGAGSGAADWVLRVVAQLGGGVAIGLVVGVLAKLVLSLRLRSQALYPIMSAGLAALSYGLAAAAGASGFIAVFVTGLIIGAAVPRHRRSIRSFHASLANGADIGLFLLLGLLVFPSELPAVALPALAVTASLIFLARPLAVVVSLLPFRLPWREQAVLSWAGLRGAVPIVLATLPATAGVDEGQLIFNVTFFVVLVSTTLQGTTIPTLVKRLGLESREPGWQSIGEAVPLDTPGFDLVEIIASAELPIVGSTLQERPVPGGTLVVTILRHGSAVLPTKDTRIEEGDTLVMSLDMSTASVSDVVAWARGELDDPQSLRRSPSPGADD